MAPQPMIDLSDVRFEYGPRRGAASFSLDIPRLEIEAGECAACIGPSGSGKSTLVNLVAGILTPGRGSVRVGGVDVARMDEAQRRRFRLNEIGIVFQEFELLDYLSALENILLPFIIDGRIPSDARARASELATALGIGHAIGRKPRRLSHGERQRVGICRALITGPRLLLCDEPTGNLDPDSTAATLDLLLEQASSRGATLIMVTHNHQLLSRFTRVIDVRDFRGSSAPGSRGGEP